MFGVFWFKTFKFIISFDMNGSIKNVYVNFRNTCQIIAFSSECSSIIDSYLNLIIVNRVAIKLKLHIIGFLLSHWLKG